MAKAGRPRAFDEFKREKFCALIQLGYDHHRAAAAVGCIGNTARREAKRNPEFEARWRDAELSSVAMALKTLRDSATDNWRAAAWLLERAYPTRYQKISPKYVKVQEIADIHRDFANELCHAVEDVDDATLKRIRECIDHLAASWALSWRPGNTLARKKDGKLLNTIRPPDKKPSTNTAASTPTSDQPPSPPTEATDDLN